ncbi:MAG TPA: hypothetical protein VG944_02025 [Fimbriimonas sp.]|nr:hypothetical protein [Fimbriimonas sp.]
MAAKAPFETHHHITPVRTYVYTIVMLLVLMGLTVYVGVHPFDNTLLNQFIALAIAFAKATLVVLIFMGVRWSTQLTKFWAMLGFTWLTFFSVMAGDYAFRQYEPVQGWEPAGNSALPRSVGEYESQPIDPNSINVHPRQ